MAIIFIMAVSGEGFSTSSSPTISTNPYTAPGMSITVSGQNFTPNGTAVLSSINNKSYTANVDKNGNASWTYTNVLIVPYPIYAIDGTTNRKSNTITIMPQLNDYTPTPTHGTSTSPMFPSIPPDNTLSPTPSPFPENLFVLLSICTATLIYILKKKSPPLTKR